MKGARSINTSALRDAAAAENDGNHALVTLACTVKKHAGEATHWRVNEDGDLEISVVTHTHEIEFPALLGAGGAHGRGVWFVPDEGTEGIIVLDEGDEATFFCRPTRAAAGVQGLAAGKVVVVGLEVLVHDGAGGAEALVKRSEFNGHTHGGGTLSNSSGTVTGVSGGAADVTGTTVLKAK